MTNFGDRFKAIRIAKGLSQQELANILGTTKQVISRYETNQRTPKITYASEYANKLRISLDYLLGETDNPFSYIDSNGVTVDYVPDTNSFPGIVKSSADMTDYELHEKLAAMTSDEREGLFMRLFDELSHEEQKEVLVRLVQRQF